VPTITRLCRSVEETAELARELALVLEPGDVVGLEGELGSGKTTLVRALAAALGADPRLVSSPTFVLINHYQGQRGRAIVHVDAYRASGAEELEAAGLADLGGEEIVLIEWADRARESLPADAARLRLDAEGETLRRARLEAPASWTARPGWGFLERGPTVCPTTGRRVAADAPSWPFADERARLADLHQWFEEGYTVSRPMEQRDLEEGT